jgi:hypothetical protein
MEGCVGILGDTRPLREDSRRRAGKDEGDELWKLIKVELNESEQKRAIAMECERELCDGHSVGHLKAHTGGAATPLQKYLKTKKQMLIKVCTVSGPSKA